MYLPDTNIFIQGLHGEEPEDSFLRHAILRNEVSISVIAIAEFYAKATLLETSVFDQFVTSLPILSIDQEVAKIASVYRKEFLKKTRRAVLLDCFLAAQAKLHRLTLVTNNRADFPMKDIQITTP